MDVTYGSVCSGIEAATQAWHPLGMRAAWFAGSAGGFCNNSELPHSTARVWPGKEITVSEVKRYYVNLDHGTRYSPVDGCDQAMNKAEDFDRVTAERDAALGREHEFRTALQVANTLAKQVISERDALQQRLTAADERADVLETVLVKQAALLDELGIPLDEVDDLFGETLKNAKRYEYLRSVMAVENFPAPHPAWSEPSEAESKRIDYLCDAALKPEEGRGDVG
jgi:hypothetical protein